jgi:magnesium-transporting ATPase (P-type)
MRATRRRRAGAARAAQGVKLGDLQATLMGMASAALFFVISHAKPLARLSPQRPHPDIFSLYVFASILGQFAVHLFFLATTYRGALAAMPPVRGPGPHAAARARPQPTQGGPPCALCAAPL